MGSGEARWTEHRDVVVAASALDAMANEWLLARASGDPNRLIAAELALDKTLREYRQARREASENPGGTGSTTTEDTKQ